MRNYHGIRREIEYIIKSIIRKGTTTTPTTTTTKTTTIVLVSLESKVDRLSIVLDQEGRWSCVHCLRGRVKWCGWVGVVDSKLGAACRRIKSCTALSNYSITLCGYETVSHQESAPNSMLVRHSVLQSNQSINQSIDQSSSTHRLIHCESSESKQDIHFL
jgi:hypothetical protein